MLKERMYKFETGWNKYVCTYQSSPHKKVNIIVFQNIGGHFANLKRDNTVKKCKRTSNWSWLYLVVPARYQNGGRRKKEHRLELVLWLARIRPPRFPGFLPGWKRSYGKRDTESLSWCQPSSRDPRGLGFNVDTPPLQTREELARLQSNLSTKATSWTEYREMVVVEVGV